MFTGGNNLEKIEIKIKAWSRCSVIAKHLQRANAVCFAVKCLQLLMFKALMVIYWLYRCPILHWKKSWDLPSSFRVFWKEKWEKKIFSSIGQLGLGQSRISNLQRWESDALRLTVEDNSWRKGCQGGGSEPTCCLSAAPTALFATTLDPRRDVWTPSPSSVRTELTAIQELFLSFFFK